MIHDILLSFLNLHSQTLPLEDILDTGDQTIIEILHPSELKILKDAISILNSMRDVAKFAKIYGSHSSAMSSATLVETDEPLPNGLYLKAFANGIDKVLDEYLSEISALETYYLQNPTHTLMHLYNKIQIYEPVALFLGKIIRGIRMQKLHGCAILSHVYKNLPHGDARITRAMKTILSAMNVVFFGHLSHWLLHAKINDNQGEFFIQCADTGRNNSTFSSDKGSCLTALSDAASATTYGDIWRYEICYELLPYFLSSEWAEKVLFIGQTVLIFKVDISSKQNRKHKYDWHQLHHHNHHKAAFNAERSPIELADSLWNGNEHLFFAKLHALLSQNDCISHHYDCVIDEIKQYVTTRLSEIAINQADLVQQLKTIKDYFLLGRGEIFLDFIRQAAIIEMDKNESAQLRDFVKAFETAAHNIGVSDILDQITLFIPKHYLYNSAGEAGENIDSIQKVQLDYLINWPLHLLFSPKVLERYNLIFRFLLLIKKTQYDLSMLWFKQTAAFKLKNVTNVKILHLRNQLMFFVNTLQYYIQVDVLESQFSILMNTINNKADFEQIQRAHSIFQANILSLCFLLGEELPLGQHTLNSINLGNSKHPVFVIFQDIFKLCKEFYAILETNESPATSNATVDELCERFGIMINNLLTMLVSLNAVQGATALSQLLLRLDFNRWFSAENKQTRVAEITAE